MAPAQLNTPGSVTPGYKGLISIRNMGGVSQIPAQRGAKTPFSNADSVAEPVHF